MAVCALTMLDTMGDGVTAAGGVLLLVLALVLAWLSTHVADREGHILGTILTVGAHASLIGLGGHDGYSPGPPTSDAPEQPSPPPSSQENKPEEEDSGSERGEAEEPGEDAVGTDLLLDIQSKPPHRSRYHPSDNDGDEPEEDDEEEELDIDDDDDNDDDEELGKQGTKVPKVIPVLSSGVRSLTTATCISVRLKFLNDTEEVAVLEPQDTVGLLKSKYFSGRERGIKLIYQGQLLQDPKRTLSSLNIRHNSVIHCHVSQAPEEGSPDMEAPSGGTPGVGSGVSGGIRAAGLALSSSSLVVPVFVVILAVVWYFRINYRQFFTAPATVSLVGVTVFFSFLIFGMHSR